MSKFKRKDISNKQSNINNPPVVIKNNGNNGRNGNGKLTAMQSRFVDEYVKKPIASQAAIKAGYSRKGAETQGCLLLRNLKVSRAIRLRMEKLSAKTEIDQEWVLKRYKMLVDYSVDDFFNDSGDLKPLSQIPRDKLYAICGIKTQKTIFTNKDLKQIEETIIREFKLPDKKGVLDSLGKYLGMFEKDNEQKRPLIPVQINVGLVD